MIFCVELWNERNFSTAILRSQCNPLWEDKVEQGFERILERNFSYPCERSPSLGSGIITSKLRQSF